MGTHRRDDDDAAYPHDDDDTGYQHAAPESMRRFSGSARQAGESMRLGGEAFRDVIIGAQLSGPTPPPDTADEAYRAWNAWRNKGDDRAPFAMASRIKQMQYQLDVVTWLHAELMDAIQRGIIAQVAQMVLAKVLGTPS